MSIEAPLHIVTADPHTLALSIRASCLVFEDPASKALLDRVHRIGPSDATALIIGETGTGKSIQSVRGIQLRRHQRVPDGERTLRL
jgi:sigma-54-specific transcriptional regulator